MSTSTSRLGLLSPLADGFMIDGCRSGAALLIISSSRRPVLESRVVAGIIVIGIAAAAFKRSGFCNMINKGPLVHRSLPPATLSSPRIIRKIYSHDLWPGTRRERRHRTALRLLVHEANVGDRMVGVKLKRLK